MTKQRLEHARSLRRNMTEAERALWYHLRAHRFLGEKFRRQQPLGPYVADFVHFGARLVIEVDGSQHLDSETDKHRDAWLHAQRFRILRIWNNDALARTESVLELILTEIEAPSPLSPNPSPARGEGSKAKEQASH